MEFNELKTHMMLIDVTKPFGLQFVKLHVGLCGLTHMML